MSLPPDKRERGAPPLVPQEYIQNAIEDRQLEEESEEEE